MKKLIAALLILAAAVSLASCSVKQKDLTYEERKASLEARESERAAESLKVESEIAEEMGSVEKEIGKTVDGKRIVIKEDYNDRTEFTVLEFDKKKNLNQTTIYMFFKDSGNYEAVKKIGDSGNDKLSKSDDEKRMLIFKNSKTDGASYDDWYKTYEMREANFIK